MKKFTIIALSAIILLSYGLDAKKLQDMYNQNTDIPLFMKSNPESEVGMVNETDNYLYRTKFDPRWKENDIPKPMVDRIQNALGIELVNINNGNQGQHETWMAINPTNPNNLIATSNDNRALSSSGSGWIMYASYSKDGGKTWEESRTPPANGLLFTVSGGGTIFDPIIFFDHLGDAYYFYGFTETGEDAKEKNGIFVAKSTDGGETWDAYEDEIGIPLNAVKWEVDNQSNPFNDRWTACVDISDDSPYKGNQYIAWKRFSTPGAPIAFSRSTDGGMNWENMIELRENASNQAPMPASGPDGTVYVAWHESPGAVSNTVEAKVIKSTDGGATFLTANLVTAHRLFKIGELNEESFRHTLVDKQGIRSSSYVQIVTDISNSEYRGNVYLVQAAREEFDGASGVYFARSTDKGESWEGGIKIDDNFFNNRDVFFPSIACDPLSGKLGVVYYSSAETSDNSGVHVHMAFSDDAGDTWQNIRLTDEEIKLDSPRDVIPQSGDGNIYWGDYTHIVAWDNKFHPLYWWPTIENNFQSTDMFTASVSPNPQPVSELLGETNCDGAPQITLNWVNPTGTLIGTDIGEFTVTINKNGSLLAELSNGENQFIDTEIEDGKDYTYTFIVTQLETGYISDEEAILVTACGSREPNPPIITTWENIANGFRLFIQTPSESVDGTPFSGFEKVDVLIDGAVVASQETDDSQIGQDIVVDVTTAQLEEFHNVNVVAISNRGETLTSSQWSNRKVVYAGESKSDFIWNLDNEENRPAWYAEEPADGPKWGFQEVKVAGNFAFTDSKDSDYEPGIYTRLNIAPIMPTNASNTFSFDHIALMSKIGPVNDYGEISYSTDFGLTWNVLKWVDEATSDGFNTAAGVEGSEWQNLAFDMSQYIDQTVLVRFTLTTDNIVNRDGWYIDNLAMDGRVSSLETEIINNYVEANVFPNPAIEKTTLNLNSLNSGNATLEIYDIYGKKIQTIELGYVNSGIESFELDLSNYISGVYFANIRIGEAVNNFRFVVNK